MAHPDEQARELAQWLHEKLCCAQNLPWEEGDICDECVESVKAEVLPLLAKARLAEAEWWFENADDFQISYKECRERLSKLRQAAGERTKP